MRQWCVALLGLVLAGGPAAGQVVTSVQQKAAPIPHEEQHSALTEQYRLMQTFARRIEIAEAGEEADVRTNVQKLANTVQNAAADLEALAKVTDSTQVGQLAEMRKYQAEAAQQADELKAEVAKTPMELKAARVHAIAVRDAAEKAQEAHEQMLKPAAAKPEPPKP